MITVVIPTHNRPIKLQRAINSVLSQTVLPEELIVVDDGSDPAAKDDVIECEHVESDIIFVRVKIPRGANHARNVGIKKATSDWIAFLDDDDEFDTEKIEVLKKNIRLHGNNTDLFYNSGKIVMPEINVSYLSNSQDTSTYDLSQELLLRNLIGGNSFVCVRKSILLDAGLFWEQLPALQDQEMWLRIANMGARFRYIPNALTVYDQSLRHVSITKSDNKYKSAYALLEERYSAQFKSLAGFQKLNLERYRIQSKVHRSLLCSDISSAVRAQISLFWKDPNMKNFALIFLCLAGVRIVYKLRQWIR